MMFAKLKPSKLLRTWPKCNGLLVFGDEYSIITSGLSAVTGLKPKFLSALTFSSTLVQNDFSMVMFKKPFITLNFATASQCSAK